MTQDFWALEFENVSKAFTTDDLVVKTLSFHVKSGEFFSILGPSGCGKTTCLRLISGLEQPTHGTIRINGKVVNHVHPHKRNVHTVFQKYALFPHLNVFDNVAFGLRMKKNKSSEIKSKVEQMLQMVKLEDYAKRNIQALSGGEQQRVALVRALVNEPDILLLDEPLGALDLKLREQMQQELAAIQKKLQTTFIFVTHDQGEALTLSDRVAIMNRGNLEQIGTPTEVYEHPATTFVAKFVGTTNVFHGTFSKTTTPGIASIKTKDFGTLFAKVGENQHYIEGATIGLVVRPEKTRIRTTAPTHSDSQNIFRGIITERIYFGPTTQVKLQVSDKLPPLVATIANQTATKMPTLKIGERYYIVWDASDSILVTDTADPVPGPETQTQESQSVSSSLLKQELEDSAKPLCQPQR